MSRHNPSHLATIQPRQGMRGAQAALAGRHHKPKDTGQTLKRLWQAVLPQKKGIWATAALISVGAALDVTGPFLLGRAIDKYVIPGDLTGLLRIAGAMLGVYALQAVVNWGQTWVITGVAQRVIASIREELFHKFGELPLEYFDRQAHGDIMSRLTNDVETINGVLSTAAQQVISGILSTTAIAVMMFYLNPPLAAVTILATACMTFATNSCLARYTREGFRAQQKNLGELNSYIEEVIGGARAVKACGQESNELKRFEVVNENLRKSSTRAQILAGFAGPIMNTITNFGLAAVGGFGGILVLNGRATVGQIATFLNYARQFGRPLNEIATTYNTLQSALAAAERVFEVLDEKHEVDAESTQEHHTIRGEVQFRNVCFSYDSSRRILEDINLRAAAGETIALIGPTGAGKTTIINLLTRFYPVHEGCIEIDGRDIRDIPLDNLRRQIAVVLQDTYLFAGTIMENIRYGRLDASDEEVREAALKAKAHHFICQLPEGYDTSLAERGGNLSQGQRQLISIARAILADPRILILDEATSSVDTRTEREIQEAMRHLMRGRTSFVIAHRLSTIRDADQILVIKDGQIVERGRHEDLIARDGFYSRAAGGAPEPAYAPALSASIPLDLKDPRGLTLQSS